MPIKVAVVGLIGNLGSRLTAILNQSPEFEVAAGVVQPDNNLTKNLDILSVSPQLKQTIFAEKMFMTGRRKDINLWNQKQNQVYFESVDQLSLKKEVEAVIDVTPKGSRELIQQYHDFAGPVILQSGAAPLGKSISPPIIEKADNNIYRQGDCLVSALVPVLKAFDGLKSVRLHLIKQYGEKLLDYPTYQRVNAIYLCTDVADYLKAELSSLMPQVGIEVEGVYQIPGLMYYTATLALELAHPIDGSILKERLSSLPRMMVVADELTSSYDIDYRLRDPFRAVGRGLPPISIYGATLEPGLGSSSKSVKIQLAIYYKLIAVLPNVDALRVFLLNESPTEAMEKTDELASRLPV